MRGRRLRNSAVVADARAFLGSLSAEQLRMTTSPLEDSDERRRWFYWPSPRHGLALGQMNAEQAKTAHHLVADVLSLPAVAKVHAIIGLEHVLDEIEARQGSRRGLPRDPALYYLTIFGDPSDEAPWAFRFEGHHVSIHITIRGDELACTPCFLGANPAIVRHDDRIVTRPLAEEEDVARELLTSVGDAAIVSQDAPDDILTTNAPRLEQLPNGAGASGFGASQRGLLQDLVTVYVERMRPDIAGPEMDRVCEAGLENMVFAWAGSTERGERHYYRLTGPTFLAEYDNTQDDANHVHAVWRDLERDFGADVLRAHVVRDHVT
jgi:Protein of unknown function (DUF3500)